MKVFTFAIAINDCTDSRYALRAIDAVNQHWDREGERIDKVLRESLCPETGEWLQTPAYLNLLENLREVAFNVATKDWSDDEKETARVSLKIYAHEE